MQDDFEETIGRTLDALLRPRVAAPDDSVLRVAVLYDDAGDLRQYARDKGLEVVYTLESGDVPSTVGADISTYDLVPPFDLLAVNLPDGARAEAFSLALRFLRVRRPRIFMLASRSEIGVEFLQNVRDRTRILRYTVELEPGESSITGTL